VRNAAFEILYKEYYVRVFGLCRRLLNSSELAEDAAQEAFMRAYKSFGKYKAEQPFWHWIASIANNYCIDLLRQQNRTVALFGDEEAELEELTDTDTPVLSELISLEEAESLNGAVANLSAKYRIPLVLTYFNQFSYEEVAQQLEISRNHVGILLLRAKEKLRLDLASASATNKEPK